MVDALPKVTRPFKFIPPDPLFKLIALAPVVFPIFTVFAFELVPRLTDPVVPESIFKAPFVPEFIFKAEPDADDNVRVLSVVIVVAPVPVNVAEVVAMLNLVLPPVMKFKP